MRIGFTVIYKEHSVVYIHLVYSSVWSYHMFGDGAFVALQGIDSEHPK
jgi:hypothetical protein